MSSSSSPSTRTLWAIADLHLPLAEPGKDMGVFGPSWSNYVEKLEARWRASIKPQDLIAIAGDISWAMSLERALIDLKWLDALPGTKILLKGNHDYWWGSAAKLARTLPPTCRALCGPALQIGPITFAGSRLWETCQLPPWEVLPNLSTPATFGNEDRQLAEKREQIFEREVQRLLGSLRSMSKCAAIRVALTHYPPIGWQLRPTRVSRYFEEFGIDWALFGHLHAVPATPPLFGSRKGVTYALTSADYLDFTPKRILDF